MHVYVYEQMVSGESEFHSGCMGKSSEMWENIHAIYRSRASLQPVKPTAVRKQDGSFVMGQRRHIIDGEVILSGRIPSIVA